MQRLFLSIITVILIMVINGCSTTGTFKVPKDTQLYIYKRPDPVHITEKGKVTVTPFFWTAAGIPPGGGIPYTLKKDGKVIKKGHLRTKFRPTSIFWPPFALIYWPMGFNDNVVYDLVNDKQTQPVASYHPQGGHSSS